MSVTWQGEKAKFQRLLPHGGVGELSTSSILHSTIASNVSTHLLASAGSAMLKEVLQNVSKHPDIKEVYMHVQSNNEAALRFYERHGFDKGELVEGYYRGIEPSSAYVVRKAVNGAAPAAVGAGAGAGAAPAVTSS